MELGSKQDQLKAGLEALKADLTEVRNGLKAVEKVVEAKLAEMQKKNDANLTQVREDIQQLLTKHHQLEASLKDVQESVKRTEAALKEALEKRRPTRKTPKP
jgi:chromosome segregation ATPase